MAQLKQALRLSRRLARDASFRRFSSSAAASPEMCEAGVATSKFDLPRPWECPPEETWKKPSSSPSRTHAAPRPPISSFSSSERGPWSYSPSSLARSSSAWSRGLAPGMEARMKPTFVMPTHISSRGFSAFTSPISRDYRTHMLHPIHELSFDQVDARPPIWVELVEYFRVHDNPFPVPPRGAKCPTRLSTDSFRRILRQIIKLVAINRKRGYDIAQDLFLGNIFVSVPSERIKLNVVSGNMVSDWTPFIGYRAAGSLIGTILNLLYPHHDLRDLSEDTSSLLYSLARNLDDDWLVNHAALLSRAGRIGLTLRISMLLRHDLHTLKTAWVEDYVQNFYGLMPYTSEVLDYYPTDSMNNIFWNMRCHFRSSHRDRDRTQERLRQEQFGFDTASLWKAITGHWLVSLNRNGIMHPPNYLLQAEMVDVLHAHTPMFLPLAHCKFLEFAWGRHLKMQDFFPEN